MSNYKFVPRFRYINAITNAINAVITFTEVHEFSVGENVSFRVTKDFGMFEMDKQNGKVLDKTSDTITVDVDTSIWTPFDYSNLNNPGTTPPVCVPSSSGVVPNQYVPYVNIEDSFDNIRN